MWAAKYRLGLRYKRGRHQSTGHQRSAGGPSRLQKARRNQENETLMFSGQGSVCNQLLAWVGQVLLLGCIWHWLKTPVCQAWQDAGCGWVTGEQGVCSPCLLGTLGSSLCALSRRLCSNTVPWTLLAPPDTLGDLTLTAPSRRLPLGQKPPCYCLTWNNSWTLIHFHVFRSEESLIKNIVVIQRVEQFCFLCVIKSKLATFLTFTFIPFQPIFEKSFFVVNVILIVISVF